MQVDNTWFTADINAGTTAKSTDFTIIRCTLHRAGDRVQCSSVAAVVVSFNGPMLLLLLFPSMVQCGAY